MARQKWRLVLTGASGGIGQAIAQALAPQCESLVLVGRNADALGMLEQQLRGHTVRIVKGDLTQAATLDQVAESARLLGGASLLINNAGANDFHAFQTQDAAALRGLLDTNLLAPMLLTQRLLPQLRQAGQASEAQVVNVGSLFGYLGYPGFAGYCASKAGLRGFTQALRRELADTGIRVRHFIPRATDTTINSAAVKAMNAEMNVPTDNPVQVAAQLLRFLPGSAWEHKPGLKEALLVLVNQLLPDVPDRAIRGQLALIRKYLPE